jgi:hypothetical protein
MSTIKDVSGTAFVVAEYRAEENRESALIYEDPIVELFLSDESRQAAARVAARFPAVKDMVEGFEAMGAPWLSGIDDIDGLAREMGLRLLEHFTTGELYRKYRGRAGSSPIFQHYSICTLES